MAIFHLTVPNAEQFWLSKGVYCGIHGLNIPLTKVILECVDKKGLT